MVLPPTLNKLHALRLSGRANALQEQQLLPEIQALSGEERLGLLVDRELTGRENRRLQTRRRQAKLRHQAVLEDLDYRPARGLDKALLARLATGQGLREHHNLLITGPTGVGKPHPRHYPYR
jgi:DNA replication protein DnaC